MAHDRRFRFGIQLSSAPTAAAWAGLARRAEELGYDTLFVPDHFTDQLAPVPAMMAAADATTDLKVGCLVFDNDYKHPVVLAKEMASLDVLSGGRTELGLGAGWMRTDYDQAGMPYDEPGVRVDRMAEGLAVLRGLFAEGPFSFQGEHYTISDLEGLPKPVQQPGPPILIGGGRPRVLRIAAQEADIVGINPSLRAGAIGAETVADTTAEVTDQKLAWVKEAAGGRYADLELNTLVVAAVHTDDRDGSAEGIAALFGAPADDVLASPHVMVGDTAQLCESLEQRRERWDLSYFVLQGEETMEAMAPVVAQLRGA
jgi:probable F420-dependent oxidoreductase